MRVNASKISLPLPDLDDKTFDELFEEARSLIPRYAPNWTNHNISDPGITLIDLFAWLTEMEIYTLNRINDRNILKFLKLLGEAPQVPKPATVNLQFSINGYQEPVKIKKETQAITVDPLSEQQLVFETDFDLTVNNINIAHVFSNDTERFLEQTSSNVINSSYYFAFGNKALRNSMLYIAFSSEEEFPENEISLFINTYQADLDLPVLETDGKSFNIIPSAKLEWQFTSEPEFALRMESVSNNTEQQQLVKKFQREFESKKKEYCVLLVYLTSGDKWTIAGFNDEGEFKSKLIDEPNSELSVELKKKPANESKIIKLVTSKLGRTLDLNWQTLEVIDDTAALSKNGRIRFQGSDKFKKEAIKDVISGTNVLNSLDQPSYWVRAIIKEPGYEIPPRIDSIIVNAVTATQANTIEYESIFPEKTQTGLSYLTVNLQQKPILANTLHLEVYEEDNTWHQWQEVSDFDASKPTDRHYILGLKTGEIKFGDGIEGRIPPEVEIRSERISKIRAKKYQVSGDVIGNVKPDSIQSLLTPNIEAKANNPRAASGGTSGETLDEAQERIRRDLKQPFRAVNCNDYETLARQTPGLRLQRVKVLPLYHPDYPSIKIPGSVTVAVVPYILPGSPETTLPKPSQGFLQMVANYLEPRCLLATRLHVISPKFIRINIDIELEIAPRKSSELMQVAIKKDLRKFLNPNIDEYENKGWPFGRAVYKSEIYHVLQGIEGVLCVTKVSLSTENCHATVNGNISIPRIGLVYLGECKLKLSEGVS